MSDTQTSMDQVRERQIAMMGLTCATLGHIVQRISAEQARELRDGADGWSIIEIVCHLRDFDDIFYRRAVMMLENDHPQLPAYDHEAMAIDGGYQEENLQEAYAALKASRQRFTQFFESLTAQQWRRTGIHPERLSFNMTDAAMQVGLHDLDHLEQITRVLAGG